MREVETSTMLPYPRERVFEAAAVPENMLAWDAGFTRTIEKLSDGELMQGSRYAGRFKGMGRVEWEFSEFERPERFEHRSDMLFGRMFHRFAFEDAEGGTRVSQRMELVANRLGGLIWPIMRGQLRKRQLKIYRELGAYLDTRPT
jgi:uncharacterized protein YndB with AHSA1/START domain